MSAKATNLRAVPRQHSFCRAAVRRAALALAGTEPSFWSEFCARRDLVLGSCMARIRHACVTCMPCPTCRFSGATPIATSAQATPASSTDIEGTSSAAPAPVLSGDQDSEITQLLKSLSKRDATTKSKALQASLYGIMHRMNHLSFKNLMVLASIDSDYPFCDLRFSNLVVLTFCP